MAVKNPLIGENPYLTDFTKSYGNEDSELNNFIDRFGDPDPNKEIADTGTKSKFAVKTSQEIEDEKNGIDTAAANGFEKWQKDNASSGGLTSPGSGREQRLEGKMDRISNRIDKNADSGHMERVEKLQGKLDKSAGKLEGGKGGGGGPGAGAYAAAGAQGYEFVGNAFGGKQFDDSAQGGGPGKAGGAIASSAGKGAMAGAAFGPWGMAIGAAVGAGSAIIGHSAAMKAYSKNREIFNLKGNALASVKMEEEYARSEGLESMNNLKALRKRQLGTIS